MLNFIKTVIVISMAFFTLFSTSTADAHDIEQFNINNIILPDGYHSCSRTECSRAFSAHLGEIGYSHQKWVEKVMEPGEMYVCSTDDGSSYINVSVRSASEGADSDDDIKQHKLIYDYNLAADPHDREQLLVELRDSLVDGGIALSDIGRIRWIDATDGMATPFIMVSLKTANTNLCEFRTVYDGNLVCVSLTSSKDLSAHKIAEVEKMVKAIRFDTSVDYSQAKQIYRQNQRVTLKDIDKKDEDSDIALALSAAFVMAVIIFSIYETTDRSRKLNESRRKSKTGKY